MPRRSAIEQLPAEIRAWIDRALREQQFGNYEYLAEELNRRLGEHGLELSIGKSALGAYGLAAKKRIESIRAATEAAALIAEAAPDDQDLRSSAALSVIQSDLFEQMLKLQEADSEQDPSARVELLAKAGRAIAEVTRASLAQKKWMVQVRAQLAAEAAAVAETAARAAGVDAATAAEIGAAIRIYLPDNQRNARAAGGS